jgi:hypothetical protein
MRNGKYREVRMDPICSPLARRIYRDNVRERGARRDWALSETNCAVVPTSGIEEQAMMMQRARLVKVIGRVDYQSIRNVDGNWWGTKNIF